ncbi:putative leucine-rich repeat-containing protein DDB_G0290503 [Chironomus tepperi]|uniref:putative leucine-rich repeat-containing protein DDB_G0290503 n=1 Tax=Chironomus tepperi TaxID=113505 RepID=UPI00391F8895
MKTNKNNDTIVDISTLAQDDLHDAYEKLAQKYSELKENNDDLNQKLHQEISHNKVLQNTLSDVQNELDSINEVNSKEKIQIERRNEELKNKNQNLTMEKIALENKIDDLGVIIDQLNKELKEVRGLLAVKAIKPRVSDTYAKSLEIENENLRTTINEMKEHAEQLTIKYAESASRIEEFTERLACVQDNLESKKVELEEKNEALEHLQEKVHEMSTELTLLRNSAGPDDNNRKGNSLFAEVDDQRQKMKKILQGERSHYLEMKKAYNSKEMEIRRLKRENLNIKSEIQACSNQLKRGEHLSSNHLKIYVSNLECDKKNLENQLKMMEERLIDLAKDQKMHWVETVLTSSSREARELKDKNYVLLREKTALADNHSKTLKELAKMRLEGIKLKSFLGRIVDEFKIKIDETKYDDLDIDEGIFENLRLEQYESLDSYDTNGSKQQNEESNDMLNESTIVLLGGRDKLGNAVPSIKENDLRSQLLANVFGPSNPNETNYGSGRAYAFTKEFYKPVEEDVDMYTKDPVPTKLSCKTNAVNSRFGYIKTENQQSSSDKKAEISKLSYHKPKFDGKLKSLSDVKQEKVEPAIKDDISAINDKENSAYPSFVFPKSEPQLPLKTTTLQFSCKVDTKVIDSTKEGYEQSKEARKKPAFTVKRIIIPSKIPKNS